MPVRIIESAEPAQGRKVRIIEEAAPAAKADAQPAIFDPLGDFTRAVGGAAGEFGRKYSAYNEAIEARARGEKVGLPSRPGISGLLSVPLAAIQGATTDQITAPAARAAVRTGVPVYERQGFREAVSGKAPARLQGQRAIDEVKSALDTSLMGLRPGVSFKPAAAALKVKATPAQRKVAEVVTKRMGADPVAEAAAMERGVPTYMQAGDEMASVAEVAAQSPGPGRKILRTAARDYSAEAPKRTKADIGQSLGGRGDYLETLDGLIETRKAEANKGIKDIEGQLVTLDEDSVMALRSDMARNAIKKRAGEALASPDAAIRADGARLNRLADDLLDKPNGNTITIRDAQEISRSLLKSADQAYRTGDGGAGEAYKALGRAVRDNAATPERGGFKQYGDWLKKYGDDVSNEEALQLGMEVFKKDNTAAAIRKRLKDAPESERDLFRKGVGEALIDQVRTKGDVAALRQLLKNEEFGERVAIAFPDEQTFAGFMESAAKRVGQQDVNNRVFGGSPTYARAAARADLEAEGGSVADAALDVVTLDGRSLAKKAAKAGLKSAPFRRPSVIADPQMNEMLARVMSDPEELTALLNLMQAARASSASRAAISRQAALPALAASAGPSEN